jgi:hypothetical protein
MIRCISISFLGPGYRTRTRISIRPVTYVFQIGSRNPLFRRRGEYGQNHQAVRTGIADRVQHTGWSQGGITGREMLGFAADLDKAGAFQNEVEFILTGVRVRRMLLTGLE